MTIDERLEALTMNLELMSHRSELHSKQLEQDGEHIRALARIVQENGEQIRALVGVAEMHERRISQVERDRQ